MDKKLANDKKSAEKGKMLDWDDSRIRSFINSAIGRKDTSVKKAEPKNPQPAAEEKVEASSTPSKTEDSTEKSDSTADKKDEKQTSVDKKETTEKKDEKPVAQYLSVYPELNKAEKKEEYRNAVKVVVERMMSDEKLSLTDAIAKTVLVIKEVIALGNKKGHVRQPYKGKPDNEIQNGVTNLVKDLKIAGSETL